MFWNNKNRQTTPKSQKHLDFYPGIPFFLRDVPWKQTYLLPMHTGKKIPDILQCPGKYRKKRCLCLYTSHV